MLRVPETGLSLGTLELSQETARYVVKVHRMQKGDRLELFDPLTGMEGSAELIDDRLPHVQVHLEELRAAPRHEMPVQLWVAIGKADKPEQALKDATVFGAEKLMLIRSQRCVAQSGGAGRSDRLQRVAEQVARQCGRGNLPELEGPISLEEAVKNVGQNDSSSVRLICAFHEERVPLLQAIQAIDWQSQNVIVLVGPEGGFSDHEVEFCMEHGFIPVDLGPYVMRAEVACGAALAVLRGGYLR